MSKLTQQKAKIAVIDIGSNSIRLVIFDRYGRYPYPLFNERITCQLGANLQQTKMLREDRIDHALETLKRFSRIVKTADLGSVHAIATAAARQAVNAKDFLDPAEKILKNNIRVLSGKEEALLVAQGLLANIPKANGIIGDLGGGSLELIRVKKGIISDAISLNFGHLSGGNIKELSEKIRSFKWNNDGTEEYFYGVGGSFRALGLAYKYKRKYPIDLLHGLSIPIKKTNRILNKIIKTKGTMKGLPLSRKETMSNAANIIKTVLKETITNNIMICGTSVRDGVVLNALDTSKTKTDPLLITCKEIAKQTERFSGLSGSLEKLLQPLIKIGNKDDLERLLKAACYLSDISWNEYSNSRSFLAAERILLLPINSITHRERAWLSNTLFYRYARQFEIDKFPFDFSSVLEKNDQYTSRTLGLALRFAMTISAGLPKLLKNVKIDLGNKDLTVEFNGLSNALLVDHVHGILKVLSLALERKLLIKN